jgi:hypothetical protein
MIFTSAVWKAAFRDFSVDRVTAGNRQAFDQSFAWFLASASTRTPNLWHP